MLLTVEQLARRVGKTPAQVREILGEIYHRGENPLPPEIDVTGLSAREAAWVRRLMEARK